MKVKPPVHRLSILLFFIAIMIGGCDQSTALPPPPAPVAVDDIVQPVLRLMITRLGLMHDVARWKWNNSRPVSDPQREEELLTRLAEQARSAGLNETFARSFFEAQIEAAKIIQAADFDTWKAAKQPPFDDALDLKSELRPQISELSEQLVARLTFLEKSLGEEAVQSAIRELGSKEFDRAGLDQRIRETCLTPLLVGQSP